MDIIHKHTQCEQDTVVIDTIYERTAYRIDWFCISDTVVT